MSGGIGSDEIRRRASHIAFGQPLVVNYLRSIVAEAVVDAALAPEWTWCSTDWNGWDFEHPNGLRLEVKQSARQQSWSSVSSVTKKRYSPRFDIAARRGYYEGPRWIEKQGRAAQIYVFALHSIEGDVANHFDPSQWDFFVVPAKVLSPAKSVGLPPLERLAKRSNHAGLLPAVRSAASLVREEAVSP